MGAVLPSAAADVRFTGTAEQPYQSTMKICSPLLEVRYSPPIRDIMISRCSASHLEPTASKSKNLDTHALKLCGRPDVQHQGYHNSTGQTKTGMIINYVSIYIHKPYSHHHIPPPLQSRHRATKQIARPRVCFVFAKENHRFLLRQQLLARREASPAAHATDSPTLRQCHPMLIPS